MAIASDDPTYGVYNIRTKQGMTFTRTFTWTDSTGVLVNLTGYSAVMKVRKVNLATSISPYSVGPALLTMTDSNGKITLGGAAGTVLVNGTAADMTFAVGLYYYDLILTSGANAYCLSEGYFDLRPEASI